MPTLSKGIHCILLLICVLGRGLSFQTPDFRYERPKRTSLFSSQSDNQASLSFSEKLTSVERTREAEPLPEKLIGQSQRRDFLSSETSDYQRGILTIGFCTLVFASLSPVNHAALASAEIPVILLNAIVSLTAFVSVSLGGRLLEGNLPETGSPASLDSETTPEWQRNPQIGGAELGFWKFAGTTANLYGLSLTTADHGAFLIQLTTLIVPMGVPISKRILTAIGLALSGIALFTQDHTNVAQIENISDTVKGDALCVLAAVFYATYDLRLFQWGQRIDARPLMTNKIFVQALLSGILLVAGMGGLPETWSLLQDYSTWCTPTTVALIAWSGITVNCLVPFLQVGGQQAIGPTTSQTIYSSQPLWAAIMSYVWFGEKIGPMGLVGASAFLGALYLAATDKGEAPLQSVQTTSSK